MNPRYKRTLSGKERMNSWERKNNTQKRKNESAEINSLELVFLPPFPYLCPTNLLNKNRMRTNLSSQISLNRVSPKYYKPETMVDRSVLTRFEKIPTNIFESMEEEIGRASCRERV